MADVEEIISFIKSLKRGFDKDLFQSKIDELSKVVNSTGLSNDHFHTLFKVWLNLSIPITKWVSLGACLVPGDIVEERTVDYAYRWLFANYENHGNFSRMAFLLDWLTAAMDSEVIDTVALDYGYEVFYTMLSFEVLTAHTLKLVYTLTKPTDVTRHRVLELLDYAKKREGKKNMYQQIQVLLGLFKSYKPECVPENVPAVSIHTSFKKINAALLAGFKRQQDRRHISSKERRHLLWVNPLNSKSGRNKKAEPLVPNMEFCNVGSTQYNNKERQKNYLDFTEPASLLQHSLRHAMSRPARLRALLCNETGVLLLAAAPDTEQAFLSHDLYHLLSSCFLDASPHSYREKQDLLHRLAVLQRTLLQGVPVVTRFLAQYLPLWNEKDYFGEIMELVEWLSLDCPEHVPYIVEPLARVYHRAQPMEQCAILISLAKMYTNLAYASTRTREHFMGRRPTQVNYEQMLPRIASSITDISNKGLQANPEDMRVLYTSLMAAERMSRAEERSGAPLGALPELALALPLLSTSPALIDKMAALMPLYKRILSMMKSTNKIGKDQILEQRKTLVSLSTDIIGCLKHEVAFTDRKSGLIFNRLQPQLVEKLQDVVPHADAKFSIRNNLAFASYTYRPDDVTDVTNKMYVDTILSDALPNLSAFLTKAMK